MFNQKSRYDVNSTMRIIGYQPFGCGAEDALLNDVLDAHSQVDSDSFELGMDMFALGVIFGKRLERARRKAARS
ncbi:MAG: hypothetical protein LIO92_09450 [Clostridiales bacterium]|nr:hypothetical protein [Clostridiales bacterium]